MNSLEAFIGVLAFIIACCALVATIGVAKRAELKSDLKSAKEDVKAVKADMKLLDENCQQALNTMNEKLSNHLNDYVVFSDKMASYVEKSDRRATSLGEELKRNSRNIDRIFVVIEQFEQSIQKFKDELSELRALAEKHISRVRSQIAIRDVKDNQKYQELAKSVEGLMEVKSRISQLDRYAKEPLGLEAIRRDMKSSRERSEERIQEVILQNDKLRDYVNQNLRDILTEIVKDQKVAANLIAKLFPALKG